LIRDKFLPVYFLTQQLFRMVLEIRFAQNWELYEIRCCPDVFGPNTSFPKEIPI